MRTHLIERIRYREETIECACGEVVTADPDPLVRDRHDPLDRAWRVHRAAVGEGGPTHQTRSYHPPRFWAS